MQSNAFAYNCLEIRFIRQYWKLIWHSMGSLRLCVSFRCKCERCTPVIFIHFFNLNGYISELRNKYNFSFENLWISSPIKCSGTRRWKARDQKPNRINRCKLTYRLKTTSFKTRQYRISKAHSIVAVGPIYIIALVHNDCMPHVSGAWGMGCAWKRLICSWNKYIYLN